jgi:amino-acid N-acetyltransferase
MTTAARDPDPTYSMARASDLDDVTALLSAGGLPYADVHRHIERFVVIRLAGKLIACAGVELHGRDALLRSVCVAADQRGRGFAKRVCDLVEAYAGSAGVNGLWLLTTTAQSFFERRGFMMQSRDAAPASIQQTDEFRSLCPASAICMSRRVGPVDNTAMSSLAESKRTCR